MVNHSLSKTADKSNKRTLNQPTALAWHLKSELGCICNLKYKNGDLKYKILYRSLYMYLNAFFLCICNYKLTWHMEHAWLNKQRFQ